MQKSTRVELGQADRGPTLRVLEGFCRVYHIQDKMQIGRMDEIILLANERDQLIFRHKEAKDDVLLAAVADDGLGDDIPHAGR